MGVPLGALTEGVIEKANQDVKTANSRFVARVSSERVQKDILTRRSWEADALLHYLENVVQVRQLFVQLFNCWFGTDPCVYQVIRRGNIRPSLKWQEDDYDQEVVVVEEDMVFMESEEEWDGDDLDYNIDDEEAEMQYECN